MGISGRNNHEIVSYSEFVECNARHDFLSNVQFLEESHKPPNKTSFQLFGYKFIEDRVQTIIIWRRKNMFFRKFVVVMPDTIWLEYTDFLFLTTLFYSKCCWGIRKSVQNKKWKSTRFRNFIVWLRYQILGIWLM